VSTFLRDFFSFDFKKEFCVEVSCVVSVVSDNEQIVLSFV